jgi:APA family basic amino acid/polyamine antiporter
MLFLIWTIAGLAVYFLYGYRKSNVGRGIVEVPELDPDAPPLAAAPMPGAPMPPADRDP